MPHGMPAALRMAAIMCVVVVFPLVPVTPIDVECVRRVAVERGRKHRKRAPRVRDLHDGDVRGQIHGALDDDDSRAVAGGIVRVNGVRRYVRPATRRRARRA